MIVGDLHVIGITVVPSETDAPLVVDPDGVLTGPVSIQRVQSVARRDVRVLQRTRRVKCQQLPMRSYVNVRWEAAHASSFEDRLRVLVREGLNHASYLSVTRYIASSAMAVATPREEGTESGGHGAFGFNHGVGPWRKP